MKIPEDIYPIILEFITSVRELFLIISLVNKKFKQIVDSGILFQTKRWENKEIEDGYEYHRNKGKDCYIKNDWRQTILHCSRAILLNPKDHKSLAMRGHSFWELGYNGNAFDDLTKSIDIFPESITYSNRGGIFIEIEEYDKAIKDLDKAIEISHNFANAYNNRGLAYIYLKDYDNALYNFNMALSIDPNLIESLRNRARVYKNLKNYELAYWDFYKAISFSEKKDLRNVDGYQFFVLCEIRGILGYQLPRLLKNKVY